MALTRRIARPLLAAIFVAEGIKALRDPERPGGPTGPPEHLVEPPETLTGGDLGQSGMSNRELVQLNGAVQLGAGVLLATGKFRRISALLLIGTVVPTTYAGHRFWEEPDPVTREQQKTLFLKNVGLVGGLLLAAFDTEGKPSLGWKAKRRAHQLEASLASATRMTDGSSGPRAVPAVTRRVRRASRGSAETIGAVGATAADLVGTTGLDSLRTATGAIVDAVQESRAPAARALQQAGSVAVKAATPFEPLVEGVVHTGLNAIGPLLAEGRDRVAQGAAQANGHLPLPSRR